MTEQTTTRRFRAPGGRPDRYSLPKGQHRPAPVTVTRREPRPAPTEPVIVGLGPAFKVKYAPDPCRDCGRPVDPGSIGRFRLVDRGLDLLVHASCVGLDEWTATVRSSVEHVGQQ